MNRENIWTILEERLQGEPYSVVQVTIQERRTPHIQIMLEHTKTFTLSSDECTTLFSIIEAILKDKNLLTDRQILEVSSPGLERPLVTREHYERYKGSLVCINVRTNSGENHKRTGILSQVLGSGVIVEYDTGEVASIAWSEIKSCTLIYIPNSLEDTE
jgi:ribosome maturation factor RimP